MINLFRQNEGFDIAIFSGWNVPEECIQVEDNVYQQLVEHRLQWQNGELVPSNDYERYAREQYVYSRIAELKALLQKTDYQSIKHSEGEMSDEEFAPIKAQRREWRAEINQLEAELND